MNVGRVKWFNEQKGFGFIEQANGPDVFVHYTNIEREGYKFLNENDEVEFELDPKPKKGLAALNVRIIKK